MAERIPQEFIDDLLSRVDIVDVVDSRVPLKKAGREYKACCPFHNEKTPSFTVSQNKQFYHCFGCGAHGTAIGFLMEYDRMSFPEAVEELAKLAGVEVPRQAQTRPQARVNPDLYEVLEQAAQFFRRQLREHGQAQKAIDYLRQRGLAGETAKRFELGFAPPGWHNLHQALTGGIGDKMLLEAGLLIEREGGGSYDRFRNRVMFPIRDKRGRVIGFGGRVIDPEDNPKYLNSPETPVFHKGRELYGLYQARQANRNIEKMLVVEGYMDVVSLAQHGVDYACATLGTAITEEHLAELVRQTEHIVFCFDGDRAGRQAAWRALETSLPQLRDGLRLAFMFLPEGEDPDSTIQSEGLERFEARVRDAMPLPEFFFESLRKQADIRGLDGQAKLMELARPLLARISGSDIKQLMVARLAQQAGMDERRLVAEFLPQAANRQAPRKAQGPQSRQTESPVRRAIKLLLQEPRLAALADVSQLTGLDRPGVALLQELVEFLTVYPNATVGSVLEHWRGQEAYQHLAAIARLENLVPEAGCEQEFLGVMALLSRQRSEQELQRLLDKSRYASLAADEKQRLNELLMERSGGSR